MEQISGRRAFLKTAMAGAAGIALTRGAWAKPNAETLSVTRLSDNLVEIMGAGCNVVMATSRDGVVMVDGGLPGPSAALIKLAKEQSPAGKILALFNTNWRPPHTGSNHALGKDGVKILAHENTRLWMGADFDIPWAHETHKPWPDYALPNDTFYTSGKMTCGAEHIDYVHVPQAFTDGDIFIHFPDSNVIAASDLVTVGTYPISDWATGGWIRGLANATKAMIDLADDKTRIIPAAGPAQSKEDLKLQHDMLAEMDHRIGEFFKDGKSVDEMVAAKPTKEFDARWGDPEMFLRLAYKGVWGHIREYPGVI